MISLEKNSLVFICLVLSLVGIGLIYIAAINIQPTELNLDEIDSRLVGRTVKTSGYIVYKRTRPEGHMFLTISENGSKMQVPLFAGFMSKLIENGKGEKLEKGARISITGLVDEYKGSLQIVPRKVEDIKILGDGHNP